MKEILAIVQFAGDYGEAYKNLRSGGSENYYSQRHSVEGIADLVKLGRVVVNICCNSESDYEEELAPGLLSVGMMKSKRLDENAVWNTIVRYRPTHLILRTPLRKIIHRASRSKINTLVTLADSFNSRSPRATLRYWSLARSLNKPEIEVVANHGRTSSEQLLKIGVNPTKVIAWDWPHSLRPDNHPPKTSPIGRPWRLLFIGMIAESKGIGDIIRSLPAITEHNSNFILRVIGGGDTKRFEELATSLGVGSRVEFLGKVPHPQVIEIMKDADIAIVPSRHEYPEGFPMTIYEALATRTPLVASDHPMFTKILKDYENCVLFPAENAKALADKIRSLFLDPQLFSRISESTLETWESLQVPVEWVQLVRTWFTGTQEELNELLERGRRDLERNKREDCAIGNLARGF